MTQEKTKGHISCTFSAYILGILSGVATFLLLAGEPEPILLIMISFVGAFFAVPFLILAIILLFVPAIKSSIEKHTLIWCCAAVLFVTGAELALYDDAHAASLPFICALYASIFYYFCLTDKLRNHSGDKKNRRVKMATALLLAFLISVSLLKKLEHDGLLSRIPPEFGVSKILYDTKSPTGAALGPGGNEAGISLYELPDDVAHNITLQKIAFFKEMERKMLSPENWKPRRSYPSWKETPFPVTDEWTGSNSLVANYLGHRGFDIPLDPDIEKMINEALSQPGSFYAPAPNSSGGIILVMPALKRVAYIYSN